MTYVLKIKFENTLRRVTVEKRQNGAPSLTFMELDARIRDMFQISPLSALAITYIDQDKEVVTMGADHDLEDACLIQGINPLRLDVKVADLTIIDSGISKETSSGSSAGATEPPTRHGVRSAEQTSENIFPEVARDSLKQPLNVYDPFAKAAIPQRSVSEIVDGFLNLPKEIMNSYLPSRVDISGREANYRSRSNQSGSFSLENNDRIFHKGVQCDLCGMTPIVGPRFRSIRKEDYDLCLSCFTELGNETDYQRIDRPVHPRRNHYHHPPYGVKMMRHHAIPPTAPLKSFSLKGPFRWKHEYSGRGSSYFNAKGAGEHYGGKLDARFVRDVSIFDGTEVTCGTNFTKIWRLRNIGSFPWPRLTRLVHVGGDILGSEKPVSLEMPEHGLPCDEEIDVAVDLVAPERPGRYVSHWRLVAPSGQKFGQRVWVLIQVVLKGTSPSERHDSSQSDQCIGPIAVKDYAACGKSDGIQGSQPRSNDLHPSVLKKSGLEIPFPRQHGVELMVNSSDVVGDKSAAFSLVERPSESPRNSVTEKVTDQLNHHLPSAVKNVGRKDSNLEMLNTMGFTHEALNVELLSKNKDNLQHTIDDLVAASGWDHMLDDLEEMGFYDVEMNRRLLFKNHGKVKLVVKELLEMQCSGGNKVL